MSLRNCVSLSLDAVHCRDIVVRVGYRLRTNRFRHVCVAIEEAVKGRVPSPAANCSCSCRQTMWHVARTFSSGAFSSIPKGLASSEGADPAAVRAPRKGYAVRVYP